MPTPRGIPGHVDIPHAADVLGLLVQLLAGICRKIVECASVDVQLPP